MTVRAVLRVLSVLLALVSIGCEDKAKISMQHAAAHVERLVGVVDADVAEVRNGLPEGAKHLAALWKGQSPPEEDLQAVREALVRARDKVQDLRVAKSTFFAVVGSEGSVLRNDQEEDRMAGKDFFGAYPQVKAALTGGYVETRGEMKEAAGVADARKDRQWIAASPVVVDGTPKGLYVTGWSWASYAYRLEFKLRGDIRSELMKEERQTKNEPLVYVFIIEGKDVFGAPVSPRVTLEALAKLDLLSKANADQTHQQTLELTGRNYGLAVRRVRSLGPDVALAVIRSET